MWFAAKTGRSYTSGHHTPSDAAPTSLAAHGSPEGSPVADSSAWRLASRGRFTGCFPARAQFPRRVPDCVRLVGRLCVRGAVLGTPGGCCSTPVGAPTGASSMRAEIPKELRLRRRCHPCRRPGCRVGILGGQRAVVGTGRWSGGCVTARSQRPGLTACSRRIGASTIALLPLRSASRWAPRRLRARAPADRPPLPEGSDGQPVGCSDTLPASPPRQVARAWMQC